MAAHVFDGDPPPPALGRAFDFKAWNESVSRLPLGMFPAMRSAFNAYSALNGYASATGRTVEWAQANPKAWDFVANVIADRKGIPRD